MRFLRHIDTVHPRFEIPIERTQARYLKVVTKPLPSTLTTDPLYQEVFVTELQLFDLVLVAEALGTASGGREP